MRHLLVVGLALLAGAPGYGGEPKDTKPQEGTRPADYDGALKLASEAVVKLQSNGPAGFFDVAFSGEPTSLYKEDRPQVEGLFKQLHTQATTRSGKSTGVVEPVRTDAVGRSFVQFVYVERLERGPLVWHLTFYRGEGDRWGWTRLNVTEQYATEFRPAPVTDKEVVALAQEGADALKETGITKLFGAMFGEGKSLRTADRQAAEPVFTSSRNAFSTRCGKALGEVELVRTETAGGALARFTYLEKGDRGAAVWKFTFYRTTNGWKWLNMEVGETGPEFTTVK